MGKLALQYGLKDLRVLEKSQELDELLNRHLGLGPGAPQHRQGNGGFQRLCRR
ncbi:aspartyl-phosphate phosphatase Spo0E family protein [Paenibacillus spiritus]|uniref:Aspartyl-phosphate phosphatase Spo0E family protein n=2 Tax=Paenibacillus TaxID=44249 RepID=A0A5J5GLU2_9BACL|nr:aspartyl-phosphate phosphatase Spo0E family protein [Paenibacillus spiritus]